MVRKLANLGCLGLLIATGAVNAQPRIISLGSGASTAGVTNGGTTVLGTAGTGAKTWGVGSSITVNGVATNAGLMLPNGLTPDGLFGAGQLALPAGVIPAILQTGNTIAGRWDATANTWTNMPNVASNATLNVASFGSSGNSSAATSARGMSQNGRYIVGQGYVYGITNSGSMPLAPTGTTAVSSFRFRPWIWDTQTNSVKILPTPVGWAANTALPTTSIYRTAASTNTALRNRDGRALCVSDDGSVVMGAWDPSISGSKPGGGGRIVIWYRDSVTGEYAPDTTVTNGGTDATWMNAPSVPEGQYNDATLGLVSADAARSVDSFYMSGDGLTIVGTSFDAFDMNGVQIGAGLNTDMRTFLCKWTRPDAASHTWTRTKLYDYTSPRSSATPGTISSWWQPYNCSFDPNVVAYPDPNFIINGMSNDGNTVVGIVSYGTCGSFVRGGFIWKAGTGPGTGMMDMYDYLVSQGTIDIANWGVPVQYTLADHTGPLLCTPTGISADGSAIIGAGGPQTLFGPGWVVKLNGAEAVAPFISAQPTAVPAYSRCSALQFTTVAGGSGAISYQWYHDGNLLSAGQQASGSVVTFPSLNLGGALRIDYPGLADAGNYYCVVTSSNGGSVQTDTVSATPAFGSAIAADLCATAQNILLCASAADNTNQLTYDACAAFVDEFRTGTGCFTGTSSADAWFRYTNTAATPIDVRIENCNSTYFSSVITVYSDCPLNGGFEVACSSATNSGSSTATLPSCSKVRINRVTVDANATIWIRVANQGTPSSSSSTGNVKVYPAPAVPTNDGCASPTTAVLGSNAFDTSESSYDANALIGGVVTCSTALSRDVWFVYTPTIKGNYVASTCYNAANVEAPLTTPNTVLTAFEAQCGGTEIICNDNSTRGTCGATTGTLTTSVNTSRIAVGLRQAGQSFWVRVGGNSATGTGPIGPGTLTISFTAVKCNAADVAVLGGAGGFDGQNTVDDLVYFLAQFFANNAAVADITDLGGFGGPDGQVTVDDLTFFLSQFFAPCN